MLYINVYASRSLGTDIHDFINDLLRTIKWGEENFVEDTLRYYPCFEENKK